MRKQAVRPMAFQSTTTLDVARARAVGFCRLRRLEISAGGFLPAKGCRAARGVALDTFDK